MDEPKQYNPVTIFPPSQHIAQRQPGDFRPIVTRVEPEPEVEEAVESDPKDLSAQESVPSLPNDPSQLNTQLPPVPPVTIAPAGKVNTPLKESVPSTQTS